MNHRLATLLAALAVPAFSVPLAAQVVVIDTNSPCAYNDAIGHLLDGTGIDFPVAGDPTIDPAPEPDLTVAAGVLGNWLADPSHLGSAWQQNVVPPSIWATGAEVARVYAVTTPGLERMTIRIGVDNGAFVWLNGTYLGGHVRPGGVGIGELTFTLTNVAAGTQYLQILCEDHGGYNGFGLEILGERTATTASFGAGCAGAGGVPTMSALQPPITGHAFVVNTRNCPPGATGVLQLVGFSSTTWNGTPLPLSLTPFGLTGCTLLVSADATAFAPVSGTTAGYVLQIPIDGRLLGVGLCFQSLVPDASANAAQAVMSDGLQATIGDH